ncbi:glycoside hydrolase family 36 protein [Microlunatus sp. Gsoil 973]|uniref:glycoside hydrolase family 36 protein n=1 Tax=Microlunatus sp. Gsoil 973 TaxID=2672569 RepID=UPI0012B461F8|nr:glycoside hydrolase family 36 protein [Microlunatus sp. Gsoil 973]QGN34704.1 alpha-galactosidase [Microlunatus sp. Gsoil 973]
MGDVVITWDNGTTVLRFDGGEDGPIRLVDLHDVGEPSGSTERAGQPLVEILTPRWGNQTWGTGARHTGTHLGSRLRYVSHSADGQSELAITQSDPESGLVVISRFSSFPGVAAVRSQTEVSMPRGAEPMILWAVTSLATSAVVSQDANNLDVWSAASSWAAENRWSTQPLRAPALSRIDASARGETIRDAVVTSSIGTWSSGAVNPAGAVRNRVSGRTLAWQIEHNGGWLAEVGELRSDHGPSAYLALLGPTDVRHHWSFTVDADHSFTSVPVTIAVADTMDDAFGRLADHRRSARRDHRQNSTLPVIFNDYMNTLMGDPSEDKLLPLIDSAAESGAEYFCIDAGWYDDTAGWWASVGDWEPSTVRFPRSLRFVLDHIRDRGMVPGLWMEPEVVGTTSRAAEALPDSAFLQRGGVRIRERDRYLLDLRSPDAVAHLDSAVDRLINDLGVGYFKFDYNVTPGAGTDLDAPSVGHGLLEHNRAQLRWLDALLDRHPELIIENCGSGAMRSDFAMLSRLALQSTSDQENPLLYPAIAVGALAHILPEQAGNWAYPQPDMSDELIIFTTCTGLAGRLYQSGPLDRLSAAQRALVSSGIAVHKELREDLVRSTPRFPTGLPRWAEPWTTIALDADDVAYLIAWRQADAAENVRLDLSGLARQPQAVEQLYPEPGIVADWGTTLDGTQLELRAPTGPAARLYRITG